jgi:hypothetical protein
MTEPADLPPPPRRRRWRRLLWLLPPLALVAAAWLYMYHAGDQRLAEAVAEAERTDPHWRLDDILTERAKIPDEENGALTALAAKAKRRPVGPWPWWESSPPPPRVANPERNPFEVMRDWKPNEALPDWARDSMRPEMELVADAIGEARKLADQPRGRYPITYSKDYISTLMPSIQDAREVAHLLSYDALFRAQSGDLDGALVSCRALINNARSIGDEPTLIAQLVRMAIRAIAIGQAERTLGQGEPSADELAALQKAMEEEAEEPLLRIAVRGERGGMDRLMQTLQDGNTSVKQMKGLMAGGLTHQQGRWGETALLYIPGAVTSNRAVLLQYMNRLVEISQMPPEQQVEPLNDLERALRKEPLLVRELLPAVGKVAEAERRTRAILRCAAAGLAAERYRREHGRWPEGLDDLKGKFLREVPLDPYDGKPLRYRKDGEGIIIYAIWKDRQDDGGDRAKLNTYQDGTDAGFRLWDVDKRRQERK